MQKNSLLSSAVRVGLHDCNPSRACWYTHCPGRSGRASCSGRVHAQPSRRELLAALSTAPLIAEALLATGPAQAEGANRGPRALTPAERAAVDQTFASTLPKAKAPVMLRLVFHDAGTFDRAAADGGANASIRLELDRPESFGLNRGWGVIQKAADKLRGTAAEGAVSLADLIALAGAHAVRITGGPAISVPVGRLDASVADREGRLPAETLSAAEQLAVFQSKGLSARDMVVLLGSHTLGNKGFGDPLTFDNAYYSSLLRKPWEDKSDEMAAMVGLPSDHVLPDDPTCRPYIERYAKDEAAFHEDFAEAYLKLSQLGARWA